MHCGPCGAAPVAALLRLSEDHKSKLGLNENSIVVMVCTEPNRLELLAGVSRMIDELLKT